MSVLKILFQLFVNFVTYVAPARLAVCFILRIWIQFKSKRLKNKREGYTSISGFNEKLQSKICGYLLSVGERSLTIKLLEILARRAPDNLQIASQLGSAYFLNGDYELSERTFSMLEKAKSAYRDAYNMGSINASILDDSWTLAIGHVAHIDVHFKEKFLNNKIQDPTIMFDNFGKNVPGVGILRHYNKYNFKYISASTNAERLNKVNGLLTMNFTGRQLDSYKTSFWHGASATGHTRLFGRYSADINARWKEKGLQPLAKSNDEQAQAFRQRLEQDFGMPTTAWYVLFHVREAGFHKKWHNMNPGTRNADVDTYIDAMKFVVKQGGWVIRGGDNSMKPLPEIPNVIDFAGVGQFDPSYPIDLCEHCEYFVGTNSGYSLVPGIFGRRSLLTNWSPIGVPNWFQDDVFIPKRIWDKENSRYLSAREMFDSFCGWSQFQKDFDGSRYEIIDNTDDEILDAVKEIHSEIFHGSKSFKPNQTLSRLSEKYTELAVEKNSYKGSKLSLSFIKRHKDFIS